MRKMDDDSDYQPPDLDEEDEDDDDEDDDDYDEDEMYEEFQEHFYSQTGRNDGAGGEGLDSDVGYSSAGLSGYSTGGDDEEVDLFDEENDPVTFLEGLLAQHELEPEEAVQQFELIRRRRRAARRKMLEEEDDAEMDAGQSGEEEGDLNEDRERFEKNIMELTSEGGRKRRKGRKRKMKTGRDSKHQPEEAVKLMGQASLQFAMNNYDEAYKQCMEIIQRTKNYPDAYHTLGMIFEAKGEQRRALDFFMIAAHFTPKDVSLWKRLASLSTDVGYLRQAIYCLHHVIKRDKDDLDAQWDRALLYAEIKELRKAAAAFEAIGEIRKGDGEVVKMLAKLYHRMDRPQKAIETLEKFLMEFQPQTDLTHINILAELYLQQGSYSEASALIDQAERVLCRGQSLPTDLQVKAGICAAHIGNLLEADRHLQKLFSEPPESYADLYMETGDTLSQLGYADRAVELYEALTTVEEMNGPELWSKLAACRREMGGPEAAARVFEEAVRNLDLEHPSYLDGQLLYMESLVEIGDVETAEKQIKILDAHLESDKVSLPQDYEVAASMLLRKERIELAVGKEDSFLDRMLPVVTATIRYLSKECEDPIDIQLPNTLVEMLKKRKKHIREGGDAGRESNAIFKGYRTYRQEQRHQRQVQSDAETDYEGEGILILKGMLKYEDQFQIFMEVVETLLDSNRSMEASSLLESVVKISGVSNRACDKVIRDSTRLKLVELLTQEKDYRGALEHLKVLCTRWPHSVRIWNRYCRIIGKMGAVKWLTKFLSSARQRCPTSVPLMLMIGHMLSLAGQYGEALGEYFQAYRMIPDDPLVLLCIGAALINHSMTPQVTNTHRVVLDGFAFLQEYSKCRSHEQETCYNIARGAHQLGLFHIAVPFYEKALQFDPPSGAGNVQLEAAHNLVQVYKSTGAIELARDVMYKYLTI